MTCLENDLTDSRRQTEEAQRAAEEARKEAESLRVGVNQYIDRNIANFKRAESFAEALRDCAKFVGAGVGPECTDMFHRMVPAEVNLVVEKLKRERDTALAALAQARGEWVACGDASNLPPEGRCVLVIGANRCAEGDTIISLVHRRLTGIGATHWVGIHSQSEEPTHWRPLPTHPPTAQNGGAV
jgi:hypothetical protein